MASTFSTNLKIELQTTGENSGTWGTITNTNLGTALEQAIVGYGNPSYASDANLTLTYTDTNAAQTARALVLNVTSAVSLTGTRELVVPTIQKQYIVQNNTTGSQSITVKTSGGTGITVPNGRKAHLYVNGTDVIYMDDYVDINGGAIDGTPIGANSASTGAFTTLSASGNITVSGGTANGVLYLNGSKVATSGSGLQFDGTRLFVGTTTTSTSSTQSGEIYSTGAVGFMLTNTTAANFPVSIKNEGSSGTRNLIRFYEGPAGGTARASVSLDGSNYLTFDTNNFIINTGNLGIGTASPTSKLDLVGIMQWQATAGTVLGKLTYSGGEPVVLANTGLGLQFFTNNAFAAKIDTSGVLLVGNTTNYGVGSAENNSVQVKGGIVLAANNTGSANNRNWIFQTNAAAAGSFSLAYSSTNTGWPNAAYALTITSSGNATVNGSVTAGKQDYSIQAVQRALTLNGDGVSGLYPLNSWRFYTTPGTIQTNQLLSIRAQDDTNGETGNLLSLTSTGNLGLGVTPSASWQSGRKAIQLGQSGVLHSFGTTPSQLIIGANNVLDGTNYLYLNTGFATMYNQTNGVHSWFTAPSGTAGNTITGANAFVQMMTLDASGNLEIGGTFAQGRRLNVDSDNNGYTVSLLQTGAFNSGKLSGTVYAGYYDGSSITDMASIRGGKENTTSGNYSGMLAFYTRPNGGSDTERARIDSFGNFGLNQNGTAVNKGIFMLLEGYTSASRIGICHENGVTSGNKYTEFYYNSNLIGSIEQDGTTAVKYNTTSDRRLKDNIVPAPSASDIIDSIQIVSHNWKSAPDENVTYGLIAQELYKVAPQAVSVGDDGDTVEKPWGVDYSKLVPMLVKEIQSLRSRVSALEAK